MDNEMCVHLSPHYKGSCYDLSIIKDQFQLHDNFTLKKHIQIGQYCGACIFFLRRIFFLHRIIDALW